jgi:general secretion pathway protein H
MCALPLTSKHRQARLSFQCHAQRHLATGFTLVEILVVLFIVSIMSGLVVANLPSFTRTEDFDTEARRIEVLLDMAREHAVVQAVEMGFSIEDEGYSFYYYDEMTQSWEQMQQAPFFTRKLPETIELSLEIVGKGFSLADDEDSKGPKLLLLSSGETTPFELEIFQAPDLSKVLQADGYSDIEWVEDEAL